MTPPLNLGEINFNVLSRVPRFLENSRMIHADFCYIKLFFFSHSLSDQGWKVVKMWKLLGVIQLPTQVISSFHEEPFLYLIPKYMYMSYRTIFGIYFVPVLQNADPWHWGTDPDPNSAIPFIDFQEANKNFFACYFLEAHLHFQS